MAKKKKQSTLMVVLTLVIAAVGWYIKYKDNAQTENSLNGVSENTEIAFNIAGLTEVKVTNNKFQTLKDCSLVPHRNNDGDSFHIKHSDGKNEIRLYFVDTAESRLHKYNAQRLADQGAYFGGLTQEKTISLGKKGKELTLSLLKDKKFDVITKWEMDPSGTRPHAYVVIEKDNKKYYLHEILTQSGLVRTKTRGAELPDDTEFYTQRKKIRAMEKKAKQAKSGAWGM